MTLGEKIIGLRKKRGLSQEELAITLGVSRQAVSKWETNEATPDTAKVVALAEYFEVTTDWLLRDIKPQSDPSPAPGGVPSVAEMLRGAPMLLNLTIGGNVFGAALMLYDLWQQTYYHIPIIAGLFIQIGMCALFLGCAVRSGRTIRTAHKNGAPAIGAAIFSRWHLCPAFGLPRYCCISLHTSSLFRLCSFSL